MQSEPLPRCRFRDLGLTPGVLPPGKLNAITDVSGVQVGHFTLVEGDDIRTGATAILPHGGNLFQEKVPAGLAVGNGFGKMMGSTQIIELGEIETPIVLTNTLSVSRAADAILDWTLSRSGNETISSINAVVGETNDGWLNNIRARKLQAEHARAAIENAAEGDVREGALGAGAGTIAFGWKGGIGSSSRKLPEAFGGYTLGALVQSNFGGVLQMTGIPVGQALGQYYLKDALETGSADGSIMIILATDAPLSDRNLSRLARRAFAGLARTGAAMSDGSGDYSIAFSTVENLRRGRSLAHFELQNMQMSPLFEAAIEATEEAIYNSLCMATTTSGYHGTIHALPLDRVRALLTD